MARDTYLGDGLYAAFDGFQVELYSSNGEMKTNRVFLDAETLPAFELYVAKLREEIKQKFATSRGASI